MKRRARRAVAALGARPRSPRRRATEVVATPERLREVDDRDFLLQGIAPPIAANPTAPDAPIAAARRTRRRQPALRKPAQAGAEAVSRTTALDPPRRDYLAGQRRTIIARSLAGQPRRRAAGAVPRRLGGRRDRSAAATAGSPRRTSVDLDDDAVNDAGPRHDRRRRRSPSSPRAAIALRIAGARGARMMLALATINRARSAARTFVAMTLFDHYCAQAPHRARARRRRRRSRCATRSAARSTDARRARVPSVPARRAVRGARHAAGAARARRPRDRRRAAQAAREARARSPRPRPSTSSTQAIETALASKTGFLSRTVAAVEVQLSAEVNPFLDGAIETLDRRWRARVAAADAASDDRAASATRSSRRGASSSRSAAGCSPRARRAGPAAIADQVVELRRRGVEVVIVSSGAIALGVRAAAACPGGPTELPALQAAAAVGQSRLMQHWEHAFAVARPRDRPGAAHARRPRRSPAVPVGAAHAARAARSRRGADHQRERHGRHRGDQVRRQRSARRAGRATSCPPTCS